MSGDPDDPDLLAAEYVLGTLSPGESRLAAERAGLDAGFAARVAAWEERLAPLAVLADPVPPPDALWQRIEESAGLVPAPPEAPLATAWRSLMLWRGATAAGFALAAGLGFLMLVHGPAPVVATLLPPTAGGVAIVVERPSAGVLRLVASGPVTAGPGHDLELWVLPRGAVKPVSLGVLPGGSGEVQVALNGPAQLMVSREPPGGSPTGAPTGPVVYQGALGASD